MFLSLRVQERHELLIAVHVEHARRAGHDDTAQEVELELMEALIRHCRTNAFARELVAT